MTKLITVLCGFLIGSLAAAAPAIAQRRDPPPWEAALDDQLSRLKHDAAKPTTDIWVVHLGITNRMEEARRFAEAFSPKLGHPVIALPSYGFMPNTHDELRDRPNRDLGKAISQYLSGDPKLRVSYTEAWDRLLRVNDRIRIVGVIYHSGGGLMANTRELRDIVAFVKSRPGRILGPQVFAMTALSESSRKALTEAGIETRQFGADDFVSWLTQRSNAYSPLGRHLGPVSTLSGIPFKAFAGLGKDFSHHSLTARAEDLTKVLAPGVANRTYIRTASRAPLVPGMSVPQGLPTIQAPHDAFRLEPPRLDARSLGIGNPGNSWGWSLPLDESTGSYLRLDAVTLNGLAENWSRGLDFSVSHAPRIGASPAGSWGVTGTTQPYRLLTESPMGRVCQPACK